MSRLRVVCECGRFIDVPLPDDRDGPSSATCGSCGSVRALVPAPRAGGGGLLGCRACGHSELYRRKDFPRPLGVAIVVVAALLAPATRYLSLIAAAVLDGALYLFLGEVVVCYVCRAEHRGFPTEPRHPRFDLEISERLRYGDRAVMGKPIRAGGTADAPEPEH